MIVRHILNNPDELLANFDWFNDYKDTRLFLVRQPCTDSILKRLDAGWVAWLWAQHASMELPYSTETCMKILQAVGNTFEARKILEVADMMDRDPLELWESLKPFRDNPFDPNKQTP
jgi:hypothetical protein